MSFSPAAFSQAVSGNINGTVIDSSGAPVPGAAVSITDLDRGARYSLQSTTDGNFEQKHLLAGRYQVKIESPGFGAFAVGATVQVDATTRVNATLNPASAQTTLIVSGDTPLVVMDRAEVATTLTSKELEKLPILDRNVTNLMLLIPGTQLNSFGIAASENPQGGIQANVNGLIYTNNGFLLDGTENQSAILGLAVVNPTLDSLQDLKISTSNYDAEFGSASGALVQATTKSGTNRLHGSLFEFLRNSAAIAADPFTQLHPPVRWNQFGGSIGGPIKKDKLFAFFDYQGTRQSTGGSLITTVPTQAERNGDLTGQLGNYICSNGTVSAAPCASPVMVTTTEGGSVAARGGMVFNPNSGDPATGAGRQVFSKNGQVNILPVAAPIAKLLQNLPMPNSGSAIFNNYIASGSQHVTNAQYNGRVDYNVTAQTHVFGRYTLADFDIASPAAFGDVAGGPSAFNFSGASVDRNQSLALGLDHTFSPTLITDARFGFYRYRIRVQPLAVGSTPALDAGLPGLNTGSVETSGMPAFFIGGNGGFNFGYALGVNSCNCPLKQTENQFQFVNNWTKTIGNHSIKFGVDVRRAQQQRIPSDSHRSGEIAFNDSTTGNPEVDAAAAGGASTGAALASFLLGEPSSFSRYFTGSNFYPGLRQTRLFLYVQDSWRVTPKLTLNYGMRWENYLPQTAAKPGGAGSFDPATGEVLAAGIGSVPLNMGVQPYNKGFAPRIGIAYQLTPKTVVRTGYGRSFTPAGLGAVFGQGADYNPPIVNPQSVGQPNPYVPAFNLLAGPPAPSNPPVGTTGRYLLPNGIGVNYFTYPLNAYRIPGADFWNFTIQRELWSGVALEAGYVGNVGRHLYQPANQNQAVPGAGDFNPRRPFYNRFGLTQGIYQVCNCGNSNYNSLQTKLQKRFAHGLDFLLTYTFAKAMDNGNSGGGFSDNYNVGASHGPADFDRTHAVTIAHNWDLPFGRGRHWELHHNAIAGAIAGGWRLSGVHTFSSGLPFTPTVANAPLLNTDFNNVRADIVGNPGVANPNRDQWYNPAAYTEPQQPFRNGTASRDSLRGPGLAVSNLSMSKNFLPMEGKSLEFRVEAFNAFNHVNLGLPNNNIDTFSAGRITYVQASMRQLQLALHFQF
jgi:outer membrane receptor protein involved in Fe transport